LKQDVYTVFVIKTRHYVVPSHCRKNRLVQKIPFNNSQKTKAKEQPVH